MQRLGSWIVYFAASVIVALTLVDDYELGKDSATVDYVFGTACATLTVSLIFIAGSFNANFATKFIGTFVELGFAFVSSAIWVLAIMYIVDPMNSLAMGVLSESGKDFKEGQEIILNANLFFFSWLSFLVGVYIVVSIIREKAEIGGSVTQWYFILISACILTANFNTLDVACNDEVMNTCSGTQVAIGVGAVNMVTSMVVIFMVFLKKGGSIMQLIASSLTFVTYLAGVAFLTSASGPARIMGNTYFAVWGGFGLSAKLLSKYASEQFNMSGSGKLKDSKITDNEAV